MPHFNDIFEKHTTVLIKNHNRPRFFGIEIDGCVEISIPCHLHHLVLYVHLKNIELIKNEIMIWVKWPCRCTLFVSVL